MDAMSPQPKHIVNISLLLAIFLVFLGFLVIKLSWEKENMDSQPPLMQGVGELSLQQTAIDVRAFHEKYQPIHEFMFAIKDIRFEGPQNKADMEEQYGTLLIERYFDKEEKFYTRPEAEYLNEAIPHLQSAAQGPYHRIGAYRPWVLALEAQEQWDAIEPILPEWRTLAQEQDDTLEEAYALEAMARQAIHNGDTAAYATLLEEAATLAPGSPAGALWGRHLESTNRPAEAIAALDAWLWNGGRLYGGTVPQLDREGRLPATLAAWNRALKAVE